MNILRRRVNNPNDCCAFGSTENHSVNCRRVHKSCGTNYVMNCSLCWEAGYYTNNFRPSNGFSYSTRNDF